MNSWQSLFLRARILLCQSVCADRSYRLTSANYSIYREYVHLLYRSSGVLARILFSCGVRLRYNKGASIFLNAFLSSEWSGENESRNSMDL